MKNYSTFLNTLDNVMLTSKKEGALYMHLDDQPLKGNLISIEQQEMLNFGSCSYLGLELDTRLTEGGVEALRKYGSQFSASRAYISLPIYDEIEQNFDKIFGGATFLAPTTTLAHVGSIPAIVTEEDAVIMDHRVHLSVQTAVNLVKSRNVHVELLRHNDLDALEDKLKQLGHKRRVWYMIDGVYSMFGDYAPMAELQFLTEKYQNLYIYADDAHGMSVFGKHGRGYVLDKWQISERLVLATSLAKGFACGGGVMVFHDKKIAEQVRRCSSTMITSGPIQPGTLGSILASSRIHLSSEISKMQDELESKIDFCNEQIEKLGLPLIAKNKTPIFFIGVSLPKIGWRIIQLMKQEGYYVNYGIFPGVSIHNTGIRFTITRHISKSDIEGMLNVLHRIFHQVINEEKYTVDKIWKAFGRHLKKYNDSRASNIQKIGNLELETFESCKQIGKSEWNQMFGNRGSFDYDGLRLLEKSFNSEAKEIQDQWRWKYFVIRDIDSKEIVLAAPCTISLQKDDMFASHEKSVLIEEKRKKDALFLTSEALMVGTQLTEGNHLYLNKNNNGWKEGLKIFLDRLSSFASENKIKNIIIRDLPEDSFTDELFFAYGYVKNEMPESHYLANFHFKSIEEFIESLTYRSRKHFRKHILKHIEQYEVEFNATKEGDLDKLYKLYLNVKSKSYLINTFDLPKSLFQNILEDTTWDVMTLKVGGSIVGCVFSQKSEGTYNPMIIGLDYNYQDLGVYRQALYQLINRANDLNIPLINFGFAADIEKRKLNCEQKRSFAFMQIQDQFNFEYLENLSIKEVSRPMKLSK
ncbi:MAG: bifunctional aminotransferase class I/II-fold pyridoxal phosphate-dependent enzyme/GNAT family N-acetyltransferase [Flavobacteriales bacterium]|nr:bifunctional aminotransferase class I/II-fold pyridoxal phosphate-dependent enzyme/GNAT family N-acetyltransferase [Flavobacteriales bacterium]